MTDWEYVIYRWSFGGPREDPWPMRDEFLREYERASNGPRPAGGGIRKPFADPEVARLRDEYSDWRDDYERAELNSLGAAGWEMVSYQKEPLGTMHAAFKRPKTADAADAPRFLGFRPREEQ